MKARVRRDGLVLQELPDELLVYDLERHRAHCLNPTAAAVFRLADGTRSERQIARALARELEVPADVEWVRLGLRQLGRAGLLEDAAGGAEPRLSRRDLIRRAGRAAGVALLLPAVVSILSPTPAMAVATCIPQDQCDGTNNGTPCWKSSQAIDCANPSCFCMGPNTCGDVGC